MIDKMKNLESKMPVWRRVLPRWLRLHVPLVFALMSSVFVLSLLGCGGASKGIDSAGDDPCRDVHLAVERAWSARIKADVMGYRGGISAEERMTIANKMDAMSEDWVRLRRSVCRDHFVRKLISVDEYKKQVRCFDARLDQQRKLVTLLKGGQAAATRNAAN